MSKPLVSIIIPTYNRAHLVGGTLETVVRQSYQEWECIIVDDGSTDTTQTVLEQYIKTDRRIQYYNRPISLLKGANACRNFGVSKAKGEYLIFLDSDDFLSCNCIENRVVHFLDSPDLDFIVFSMGLYRNNKFEEYIYKDVSRFGISELMNEFLNRQLPWNMTRPIWKRDFFLSVKGGFNEKMQYFQDDEFNVRSILKEGVQFKMYYVTDCYYRVAPHPKSFEPEEVKSSFYYYLQTIFSSLNREQINLGYRKIIIEFYYNFIRVHIKGADGQMIDKIEKGFFASIDMNTKERLLLKVQLYLNKYYYNNKGYQKMSKLIKSKLISDESIYL